jgi:hypothetical protein
MAVAGTPIPPRVAKAAKQAAPAEKQRPLVAPTTAARKPAPRGGQAQVLPGKQPALGKWGPWGPLPGAPGSSPPASPVEPPRPTA